MTARILKSLALTLVLGGVFAGSAFARPIVEPSIYSTHHTAAPAVHPIVSEKVAGLQPAGTTVVLSRAHYQAALQRGEGLNRSESSAVVASSGNGFDWSNTGIGVGIAFAVLLAVTGVALSARRHHPVAH